MQATTNKRRTQPPLPTLPAHVHRAAVWLDDINGIGAMLIDRETAQHLLGTPGWRLVEIKTSSLGARYYFDGPAGSIRRHPDHKGWFVFYPEFRTEV